MLNNDEHEILRLGLETAASCSGLIQQPSTASPISISALSEVEFALATRGITVAKTRSPFTDGIQHLHTPAEREQDRLGSLACSVQNTKSYYEIYGLAGRYKCLLQFISLYARLNLKASLAICKGGRFRHKLT